ncbi:MAG TPA: hypothetical protein VF596_00515 [Pyrinomonadaceae bacterium]
MTTAVEGTKAAAFGSVLFVLLKNKSLIDQPEDASVPEFGASDDLTACENVLPK